MNCTPGSAWTPEQLTTLRFMIWWFLAFLVWAFARLYWVGPEASVSIVLAKAAGEYPVWVLALGIIMGHWFWPLR